MRVVDVKAGGPIRTSTVVLTSKDVVAIRNLCHHWMESEGQSHIAAGFGFATEHIAGMLKEFTELYDQIWPKVNPATGQTPE